MSDPKPLLQQAFPTVSEENLATLAEAARPRQYRAQQYICRQGEKGETLYIIAEGTVDIIVRADGNHEVKMDSLHAGQYFGEMALFGHAVRMASVRAATDCLTYEIDHEQFFHTTRDNPDLLRAMLSLIIGHLRSNDRKLIHDLNLKNQALQTAYADLAEQEQLRAQFIATLSHELRTPLTSIRGFLGLMTQGAFKGESFNVALGSIVRNVEKLVSLTNSLLVLYEMTPKAPEFEVINVMDLMVEALNALRESEEVDMSKLNLTVTPDLPNMNLDKNGLVLAIRALVDNAFKFTINSEPVQVSVYRTEQNEVAVEIRDSGIGIPEEELERIFEPFYRLETEGSTNLFPGMGVGLTIAKIMVERHNGRIDAISTPNDGSTFTILLPIR